MKLPAYVGIWLWFILVITSVTMASVLTENFSVEQRPLICHPHRTYWLCERKP